MTVSTRADVARLFGRAAFGATAADLDRWTGQPYEAAVEHLLAVPAIDGRPLSLDEAKRALLENGTVGILDEAQRWWLERMRITAYPLEERLTLLWHDHFATAYRIEGGPYAYDLVAQNQVLRRHALGNFRTMCEDVTVDTAMIIWLDAEDSTRRAVNENYAREFFELFTLGVRPQRYTETDIREAARAFTGWIRDSSTHRGRFQTANHDSNPKVILGRPVGNLGANEYKEVVDIAVDQLVAPLFVAGKLVTGLAYEVRSQDLIADPDPLVNKVAAALAPNWDLKAGVRALLLADEFRYADPATGHQLVRSPVELVVHIAKALGFSLDSTAVLQVLRRMAQVPFEPPNVGGWPGGEHWLTTATTIARYDWGVTANGQFNAASPLTKTALPASGDLAGWVRRLGLAGLNPNTEAAVGSYLASRATAAEAEKQTGVMILLASSPDFGVM